MAQPDDATNLDVPAQLREENERLKRCGELVCPDEPGDPCEVCGADKETGTCGAGNPLAMSFGQENTTLRAHVAQLEEALAAAEKREVAALEEAIRLSAQGHHDRLWIGYAIQGMQHQIQHQFGGSAPGRIQCEIDEALALNHRAEKAEAERDEARADNGRYQQRMDEIIVALGSEALMPCDVVARVAALRSRVAELERELTREQVSCELECASKAALERWIIDQHPAEQDAAWTYQCTETRVERDALRAALAGAEEKN